MHPKPNTRAVYDLKFLGHFSFGGSLFILTTIHLVMEDKSVFNNVTYLLVIIDKYNFRTPIQILFTGTGNLYAPSHHFFGQLKIILRSRRFRSIRYNRLAMTWSFSQFNVDSYESFENLFFKKLFENFGYLPR